jgi:hypothetical protein
MRNKIILINSILLPIVILIGNLPAIAANDGGRYESNGRENTRDQVQPQRYERSQDQLTGHESQYPLPAPAEPQTQPTAQPMTQPPADTNRHAGRMSLEDRRALRRQIDQANHDIYSPSR